MNRMYEHVARRAYELFLARGAQHGCDVDDWLEAERQLMGNGSTPGRRTRRPVSEPRTAKTAARQRSR